MMPSLSGKHIMITGASEGLGRELALVFAREGATSLALVARRRSLLQKVAAEIEKRFLYTRVTCIDGDVGIEADVERITAAMNQVFNGRLDVLVNNASVIGPTPMPFLLDYPTEDFREVLNTNLVGPFLMMRYALPSLIEHGGSVINVTSDAGVTGYPGWGAYGISKFGLEGMSQTWAAELEDTGVRVNLVDPGDMNTAMHRAAEPDEDPGEWADPSEVTGVFVFLASDNSREITGKRLQAQENWQEQITESRS
jgi:NAD(P)-dependent dehydrogenase (short-subunit alcohol dehydrogenase family)